MRLNFLHRNRNKFVAEERPEKIEIEETAAHNQFPPLQADQLTYTTLKPNKPLENKFALRLAAHLLRLEAQERGQDTPPTRQELLAGIDEGTHMVTIASAGMCVRGIAMAGQQGEESVLTHWYVVEKERGKGVGKKLLDEAGLSKPEIPSVVMDIRDIEIEPIVTEVVIDTNSAVA